MEGQKLTDVFSTATPEDCKVETDQLISDVEAIFEKYLSNDALKTLPLQRLIILGRALNYLMLDHLMKAAASFQKDAEEKSLKNQGGQA